LLVGLLFVGGLPTPAHAEAEAHAEAAAEAEAKEPSVERILGYWQRGEGEAIIEVRRTPKGFSGVIVTSDKRPETVGIEVFRELQYNAEDGEWHGRAYSIKRKREVKIDIEVPKADKLDLTAHILFFTRLVQFTRIPDAQVAGLQLADR
jgi:uncharacterized protein (DUF2147 family)